MYSDLFLFNYISFQITLPAHDLFTMFVVLQKCNVLNRLKVLRVQFLSFFLKKKKMYTVKTKVNYV